MTLPFIERELRVALRRRHPARSRFWLAIGGGAASVFFSLMSSGPGGNQLGGELHKLLFVAAILFICQIPRATCGLFAEERRTGTLGFLFLAGVRPAELFFGKLIGGALATSGHLLGLLPFLAIAFLVGGVSFKLFAATMVCLPLLLLFVFAVSTLASVLAEDEGVAMFVAALIGGAICLATPVTFWASEIFSDGKPISRDWLALSPTCPAWIVWSNLIGTRTELFWTGCGVTVAWSLLCFGIAGFVVTRVWQDKPEAATSPSWKARLNGFWRGRSEWRRALGRRWLDSYPFAWLAMRDRSVVNLAWLIIGGLMALWLAAYAMWPQRWPGAMNLYLTAVLLVLTLSFVITYAAAKTIGGSRSSGALELLLCTPLKEADIVHGQLAGLRAQFRPVVLTVIGIETVFMIAGFLNRGWTPAAATVYFVIWAAIFAWTAEFLRDYRVALVSFWDGLVCGRPSYVAWRHSGFSVSPFWIGWMMIMFGRGGNRGRGTLAGTFPEGSIGEIFFVAVSLVIIGVAMVSSRRQLHKRELRLLAEMRAIAQEPPPEPGDARYKDWRAGERFPEPLQHELVRRAARRHGKSRQADEP